MVHLEVGGDNAVVLQVGRDLAERFKAGVIGIAACQPMPIMMGDGYVSGELIQQGVEQLEYEVRAAEATFRAAFAGHGGMVEWRSATEMEPLADYIARQARAADLVITGVDHNDSVFDMSRHVGIGDLVTSCGRPVLIVPAKAPGRMRRVLVGWQDTQPARRAIADALPLLAAADSVVVVEIAETDEVARAQVRLADVVGWLGRHGVSATVRVETTEGAVSAKLDALANEIGADVLVAGAYGHTRLREWMLGGVTDDLLLTAARATLVSH
jgi:nucleotide-binding universal stress UspA family protein